MQKIFFGKEKEEVSISDLSWRESIIIASVVFFLVFLGLYPKPVTKAVEPTINEIILLIEDPEIMIGEIYQLEEEETKD